MHCVSGLGRSFGADQKPVANFANSGYNHLLSEIAECVGALDFPQEQEITQERKVAPRATEDRSGTRPRNPGSPDSRALSRRHCLRNLGRKIAGRNAALPGGQRLAEQIGPRFPGFDQDGTGPGPRASVESGERDDVAIGTAPRLADDGPKPRHGKPASEVDWLCSLVIRRWPMRPVLTTSDQRLTPND